ncbi:hypothetical protein P9775_006777, partial [Pseudomonas aeruginosa]
SFSMFTRVHRCFCLEDWLTAWEGGPPEVGLGFRWGPVLLLMRGQGVFVQLVKLTLRQISAYKKFLYFQ